MNKQTVCVYVYCRLIEICDENNIRNMMFEAFYEFRPNYPDVLHNNNGDIADEQINIISKIIYFQYKSLFEWLITEASGVIQTHPICSGTPLRVFVGFETIVQVYNIQSVSYVFLFFSFYYSSERGGLTSYTQTCVMLYYYTRAI